MDEVRNSVYQQMRAERERIAAETRLRASEAADADRVDADKDVRSFSPMPIVTEQIIRGEGERNAAEIYAKAYNRDPEFYAFYRSIDAYRKSIGKEGDVLVLDPNNEFFRYLNQSDGEAIATEIFTAIALVLIIEGMLPFISPQKYRQMVAEITRLSDNNIRNIGLVVMAIGLASVVLCARLSAGTI